jgi:hypothetical protein
MQVVKAAGGSFRLARTFPGSRTRERELKDRHEAPRLCPICTPHPRPALADKTRHSQLTRMPEPAAAPPSPARPPAYDRGAARARRAVQQQINAGFSAARIAEVQGRILAAFIPERARAETREEARGYRETAEAMIAAHRQAATPQAATTDPKRGTTMNADNPSSALPIRQPTEWMKGAKTAHDLITRQVEAGYSADRIAERWDQALATYDDATATPAEREWHAGAEETARDMIQTWRDIQTAEAEQRQADEATREASQQTGAQANWEAEAG